MNILPLIFTFLMVFSILSTAFMHKMGEEKQVSSALQGSLDAQILLDNKREMALFASQEGKDPNAKKTSKPSDPKEFHSFRLRSSFAEVSKLSLYPLKEAISIQHKIKLEAIFKQLITNLYQDTPLSQEVVDKLDPFCKEITAAIKNSQKEGPVSSLELSQKPMQLLLYKMCKGGKIPSLEDFVTLQEFKKKRSVFFRKASANVLKAALGSDSFEKVIQEEEKKFWESKRRHIPLKNEELFVLIGEHNRKEAPDFAVLESIFSFDRPEEEEHWIRVKDRSSQISKEVYTSKKVKKPSEERL